MKDILFPYKKIRKEQDKLIKEINKAIKEGKHLIAHAPTGLGKTVAALGPALRYAIDNNKTIFFLTSRHTQHIIVIETLKQIKEKYSLDFSVVDMIGKRWMCLVPGIEKMNSSDFHDYCKTQVETKKCEFYLNFKKNNKISVKAKKLLDELKKTISHTEGVIESCGQEKICPYEISALMAKDAKVIVADYYYIFNESIRNGFFTRTGLELNDCILIVDEAHNLSNRIRDLLTVNLSNFVLKNAIKEAKKYYNEDIVNELSQIQDILNDFSENVNGEKIIDKNMFVNRINKIKDYYDLMEDLDMFVEFVKGKQKRSYVSSVLRFLDKWLGEDVGFARILGIKQGINEPIVVLSYRCLDSSKATKDIIKEVHSIICMSGTLTPTEMYASILGFDKAEKKEFDSPFPKKNKLNLIVPETTTKFTKRNEEQFKNIARICADIVNKVPGNCAVFFPSYELRNNIDNYFSPLSRKAIFLEKPELTKSDKTKLLSKFKKYKDTGAVLLCTASGSFGESIDLPGDLLKCVIVVGLPLNPPDMETKKLIEYYDKKFGRGWQYGYIFPAITKCLQNAGRCIRSETDKGVIVFLDERFAWENYLNYFPKNLNVKITKDYVKEIGEFFSKV